MGKAKRKQPDVEELLARPWCYYCERDFDDLKILINHQKAKHYKCDKCGRRLNTAGGLSVHMSQVHKEALKSIENALPNRAGLEVEIFGMEGVPQDVIQSHNQRVLQQFAQAEADRRALTGNPAPGSAGTNGVAKKPKFESPADLKKRLAEHKAKKALEESQGEAGGLAQPAASTDIATADSALQPPADPSTHQPHHTFPAQLPHAPVQPSPSIHNAHQYQSSSPGPASFGPAYQRPPFVPFNHMPNAGSNLPHAQGFPPYMAHFPVPNGTIPTPAPSPYSPPGPGMPPAFLPPPVGTFHNPQASFQDTSTAQGAANRQMPSVTQLGNQQPPNYYSSIPSRPTSSTDFASGLPQKPAQIMPSMNAHQFSQLHRGNVESEATSSSQVPSSQQNTSEDKSLTLGQTTANLDKEGETTSSTTTKKEKEKAASKLIYSDNELSPEEKMAGLARYAFVPITA